MKVLFLITLFVISCQNSEETSTDQGIIEKLPLENEVTTHLKNVPHFDGFLIQPNKEIIYAGGWNKNVVGRILPDGSVSSIASGLGGPVWVRLAKDNSLYISNFSDNTITRIEESGRLTKFATGLDAPAPIAFKSNGDILIGNYGVGYDGNTITKISPAGVKELYLKNDLINAPIGLEFDKSGILYIANQSNGKILKYDGSNLSVLATSPSGKINHMVYMKENLYFTSHSDNSVYRVSLLGDVNKVAGTGSFGNHDGPALEATFKSPNGLATDGVYLYVADNIDGTNTLQNIRKIAIVE